VGAVEVPLGQAAAFGVLEVDEEWRIVAFQEKPKDPRPIPGKPDRALVNMGVYCFETETLVRSLRQDAQQTTRHDFGHDILPGLIAGEKVFAYPFVDENRKETRYWRDIGTVVFPDALLKVFLTASVATRVQRRHKQLNDKGKHATLAALSHALEERDKRDAAREVAPLKPAPDAHILDTSTLAIEAVVGRAIAIVEAARPRR
jgi:NDP-sugar pyrophosphorylase family protein